MGEVGHPEEVHNWDTQLALGQVAGVTMDLSKRPFHFHLYVEEYFQNFGNFDR